MKTLIVVPSRYGSTRFPAKVLAELDGKPIVQWCWEAARGAGAGDVLIATEDQRVADAVRGFGGEAVLTSDKCQSGTDRVYEAAKGSNADLIINVQGDQPLIKAQTIKGVIDVLIKNPNADISTAVMPLDDAERLRNPNVVKAAMAESGRCLYFSRSPIPYPRNPATARTWEHLGIYGYRRATLDRFVSLPPSPLELTESLEQLRALEAGMTIFACVVSDVPVAIDAPEDLKRAETFLRRTP